MPAGGEHQSCNRDASAWALSATFDMRNGRLAAADWPVTLRARQPKPRCTCETSSEPCLPPSLPPRRWSAAAHADQLADIKKKGEIVVGVLGTDEPNSFVDPKTREIVGYEVDLVNAIAKKIGVKPVFKQIAVAARIPELQQGHVDLLAASLTHNKEREAQIDFSLTTFVTGQKVHGQEEQRHHRRAAARRQEGADRQGRHAGAQHPQGRAQRRGRDLRDHASRPSWRCSRARAWATSTTRRRCCATYAKLGPAEGHYVILPTRT